MKRFLVRCGVEPGKTGNVQPLDTVDLLCVAYSPICDPVGADVCPGPFEPEANLIMLEHSYECWLPQAFTTVVENAVTYIAGWVVRKACTKLSCDTCKNSLITTTPPTYDRSYNLLMLKNNGGLVIPSSGSVTVIMCAEKMIRRTMNIHSVKQICRLHQILYNVKTELGTDDLFDLGTHITHTTWC